MEKKNLVYAEAEEVGTIPEYKDIGVVYQRFVEWFYENGGKMNGVQWPAYFGKDNLRGVIATRDIKPYEVVMYVPNKILITTKLVQEDSVFGPILKKHPNIFKENVDWEYNIQIIFIMAERAKGFDSFWHPYFDLQPVVDTPVEWDDEDLNFIEDPILRSEINDSKIILDEGWKEFHEVVAMHPELFTEKPMQDYIWASQFVTTRCFGWYLPYTMMVPMVDNVNHDHIDLCTTEIINIRQEKELNKKYLKEIDYRKLIKSYDMSYMIPEQKFVASTKKHNIIHFLYNYQKLFEIKQHLPLTHSLNEIIDLNLDERCERMDLLVKKLLKTSEMDIWDVPNVLYSDTEDNDTSSEDNGDEEDPKKKVNTYYDGCVALNSKLNCLLHKPAKITMKPREFKEDEGKVDDSKKKWDYNKISFEMPDDDKIPQKVKEELTKEEVVEKAIQETYAPEVQEKVKEEAITQEEQNHLKVQKSTATYIQFVQTKVKEQTISESEQEKLKDELSLLDFKTSVTESQFEQTGLETIKEKSIEESETTAITSAKTTVMTSAKTTAITSAKTTAIPDIKVSKTELYNDEVSSEEDLDSQIDFPWYDYTDNSVYYILTNNDSADIKKGKQLYISYGKRQNRYLLTSYGFSLKYNIYDSLSFRIAMDKLLIKSFSIEDAVFYNFQKDEHLDQGYFQDQTTKDPIHIKDLSKEFKSKYSCLNIDLVSLLRTALSEMYKDNKLYKQDETFQQRTKPEDLEFEVIIFENYIKLFEKVLSTYKRTNAEDNAQYNNEETNWKKRMILNVEMNYKKIAHEQINQANIVIELQTGLAKGIYKTTKEGYMNQIDKADGKMNEAELVGKIHKLKKYLEMVENLHCVKE